MVVWSRGKSPTGFDAVWRQREWGRGKLRDRGGEGKEEVAEQKNGEGGEAGMVLGRKESRYGAC